MVERSAAALDRVFRALASESRREILRQVARERRTVGELAENFDMSLAAVSKHVGVLAEAELIVHSREGRLSWCRLNPEALAPARASLEELSGFWSKQLDGLHAFLRATSDAAGKRRVRKKGKRA